jgi:hypothetical protein
MGIAGGVFGNYSAAIAFAGGVARASAWAEIQIVRVGVDRVAGGGSRDGRDGGACLATGAPELRDGYPSSAAVFDKVARLRRSRKPRGLTWPRMLVL